MFDALSASDRSSSHPHRPTRHPSGSNRITDDLQRQKETPPAPSGKTGQADQTREEPEDNELRNP